MPYVYSLSIVMPIHRTGAAYRTFNFPLSSFVHKFCLGNIGHVLIFLVSTLKKQPGICV